MTEDEFYEFPGLFEKDSSADVAIMERWQNKGSSFGIKIQGEISEYGIISEKWGDANKAAIHPSWLECEQITKHYDMETLSLIDFRLRWCRWYLDANGLPYDKEDIFLSYGDDGHEPGWCYISNAPDSMKDMVPQDPLNFLLMWNFAIQGSGYAGKILAHFRRAERLLDKPELTQMEAISLSREWMLIGETWAEAKFVINHSKAAISGEKVAGGRKNSAHITNQRHSALRQKRFKRMAELIPSLGIENAARKCEAEGLGGWSGIRRQWDRFHKKSDT